MPNPVETAVDIERVIDVVARAPNAGLVVLPDSATATSSLISRHGIAYRQSMRFAFL